MSPERLNILLVEEDAGSAAALQMVLGRMGHSVDVSHDGADAFARLTSSPHRYNILIADHCTRDLSGLQLLAQLRGSPFSGGIIVLSAFLSEEMEQFYLALGAGMILWKPFEITELRYAVEALTPLAAA